MENTKHTHNHDSHPDCHELLDHLSDYIDGTLRQDLCTEIENHLKICINCTIVVDTLKKTIELYQEASKTETMPNDMRRRLYKNLNLDDYLEKQDISSPNDCK